MDGREESRMEAAPVGAFVQALSSPPLGCYTVLCLAGWLLLFYLSARKALYDDKVVHDVHALAVTGLCVAAHVTDLLPEAYVRTLGHSLHHVPHVVPDI